MSSVYSETRITLRDIKHRLDRVRDLLHDLRLPDGNSAALGNALASTPPHLRYAIATGLDAAEEICATVDHAVHAAGQISGVAIPDTGTVYDRANDRRMALLRLRALAEGPDSIAAESHAHLADLVTCTEATA